MRTKRGEFGAVSNKHENKIQNEKKREMRRSRGWKQGHEKKVIFAFIFVSVANMLVMDE